MPKTRKKQAPSYAEPDSDTESSDAGSSDHTPVKQEKQSGASGVFIALDKHKRLTVSEFKGKVYVHIRHFYEVKDDGEMKPTRKGIALSPELWKKLLSHADDINAALAKKQP